VRAANADQSQGVPKRPGSATNPATGLSGRGKASGPPRTFSATFEDSRVEAKFLDHRMQLRIGFVGQLIQNDNFALLIHEADSPA
jgi:hypothetical protein